MKHGLAYMDAVPVSDTDTRRTRVGHAICRVQLIYVYF